MDRVFYTSAVTLVLAVHLGWIIFVVGGALLTRGRPKLTVLHLASLLWGIVVETGPWPCPLTMTENFFEARIGIVPYSGSCLVHYLDSIVYPDLPVALITAFAVAVCAVNLAVYCYRLAQFLKRRRAGS